MMNDYDYYVCAALTGMLANPGFNGRDFADLSLAANIAAQSAINHNNDWTEMD
ncbi:MAG: hypothetical protein KGI54_15715 [Pseudomonadota bacterium]|nr:hypothetical protein [Pseudomonadota bacterium]